MKKKSITNSKLNKFLIVHCLQTPRKKKKKKTKRERNNRAFVAIYGNNNNNFET